MVCVTIQSVSITLLFSTVINLVRVARQVIRETRLVEVKNLQFGYLVHHSPQVAGPRRMNKLEGPEPSHLHTTSIP